VRDLILKKATAADMAPDTRKETLIPAMPITSRR